MGQEKYRDKKRVRLYRVIKCLVLAALLLTAVFAAVHVLERKDADIAKAEFYSSGEDYDVLFMGTSRMMNGVLPMELWADYGITSYNLSGHAQYLPVTYWVLKDALTRCEPKVVVVDTFAVSATDKVYTADMAYLHNSLDVMPFSWNKLAAIWDLVPEKGSKMEYLFDFTLYHSRWQELTQADFRIPYTLEKGAESRINVYPMQTPELANVQEKEQVQAEGKETTGMRYLRRIMELCESKNCKVVLVNLPHYADVESQKGYCDINVLAQEYGVTYINYLDKEHINTINFATDIYDEESHLNPSGAKKVTKDLGAVLVKMVQKKDTGWEQDYKNYREELLHIFENQESLPNAMMLAADSRFQVTVTTGSNCIYEENESYIALLANIEQCAESLEVVVNEVMDAEEVEIKVQQEGIGETILRLGKSGK